MSRAVAEFPWETTPLGPMADWPPALKIACGMMLNSHFPKAIAWGSDLTTIYNSAFAPILGEKKNSLGRSFADIWAEAWDDIEPIAAKAMNGSATFIEDFPLVINRHGYDETASFTFCYSPIYDERGTVCGFMDTVIETTAKVEQQKRTDFLNRELHHRIKNMLASVAAIANQTVRGSISINDARVSLQHRIAALANAHTKILDAQSRKVDLEEIVRAALSPHLGDGRVVTFEGPRLDLDERQSMALALTVNELTTNAVKFGAFSQGTGSVMVTWGVDTTADEGRGFFFVWAERGGPAVAPPSKEGFGSILLSQIAPVDFGGEVSMEYGEGGFVYRLFGDRDKLPVH
ncbi:sensor histidine kinase [Roseibium sp. CAU 1637]|uniref:histidine kinase n=1 Tax=Roseibium limicola TaxID=2816037 RepID=A0A939J7B6_9HYPH|nr:PAS domain-containing sensor histidine kinase [Roseibium limicola]MBO0343644.1 sensor histidine kinase [Roseibium limicola]